MVASSNEPSATISIRTNPESFVTLSRTSSIVPLEAVLTEFENKMKTESNRETKSNEARLVILRLALRLTLI
jgi:hypothetical protein